MPCETLLQTIWNGVTCSM